MIKTVLASVFGTRQAREVRRMMPMVHEIHRHEERLKGVSEEELKAQTARFRERIARRSAVGDTAKRTRFAERDRRQRGWAAEWEPGN